MSDYRIGRLGKQFVLTFIDGQGKRRRYRLDARDAGEAHRVAPGIYAELTRPKGKSVAELWESYRSAHPTKPVVVNMVHNWKALADRFGPLDAEMITAHDCRAHIDERRNAGIKDGTICTELGRLRLVLSWARKERHIERTPHIETPSRPKPKTDYLTKDQARALMAAAIMPHLRLYIILALTTGARNAALLGLTWDRVDLQKGRIDFRDPAVVGAHKGRAIVPCNRTLTAALQDARSGALTAHVIEWAGSRVASVKKGLSGAARRAGLAHVSPHMLRHSAAVHMAEDGVPISEISQFLGHSNTRITEAVYARFSPDYLRGAAAALEYDMVSEVKWRAG